MERRPEAGLVAAVAVTREYEKREVEGDSSPRFPAFPFTPYPIQLDFMRAVYSAVEKGGVAIVESPTGTGKTLSLICSALQWLLDFHERENSSSPCGVKTNLPKEGCLSTDDEPDWMSNYESQSTGDKTKLSSARKWQPKARGKDGACHGRRNLSSSILSFGYGEMKSGQVGKGSKATMKSDKSQLAGGDSEDDEQYLVEDYCSDEESAKDAKRKLGSTMSSSSGSDEDAVGEEEDDYEPIKVFFCSRTHSQLSQFIGELKRTSFASSVRAVSLGSRKNLCINSEVSALGSTARINDRCLELQRDKQSVKSGSKTQILGGQKKTQRKSVKPQRGCPMMSKRKLQRKFVEEAFLEDSPDIEDLVRIGTKLGTCPYYGSRSMVRTADLVVLPYQSILHGGTRESLNIKLKDSVVVIDEAHNLVDTVSNIYSCYVSSSQLKQVNAQLSEYLERFRKRLAATNRRYCELLLGIIRAFIRLLAATTPNEIHNVSESIKKINEGASTVRRSQSTQSRMVNINDFLFSLEIDNLNLFKIRRYIKESNIVHKVSSYGEKFLLRQMGEDGGLEEKKLDKPTGEERPSLTSFHNLAEFLLALTNADGDGRVLITPGSRSPRSTDGSLKFIMLNAAKHFAEVLEQARAVILAGGTLQPVDELRVRLLPHLPDDKLHIFSCGHIVPPESILPMAIARGPTCQVLDFTYQSRGSPLVMEELGRVIKNISAIVPEGVVVFFPSFEYENQVFSHWRSSEILSSIEQRKTILREPRDAGSVESTLQQYRELIVTAQQQQLKGGKKTGALLLCVVGGKMSEGINFSDGMGRCVVMVGMPYPNPSDPELLERIQYIDKLSITTAGESSRPQSLSGGHKGRDYYENLCMKAVNQSIGRSIRHIRDYAAILLLDSRYARYNASSKPTDGAPVSRLPGWIRDRMIQVTGNFGEVHKHLHQFFKYNKTKETAGVS